MITLFVTDLDGTLLNEAKRVDRENREALHKLASTGVEICLASGRMHVELSKLMDVLGQDCHRISQNGACIYTKTDRLLRLTAFEPEVAVLLYRAVHPYDFVEVICMEHTIYIPRRNAATEKIETRMFTPFTYRPDIIAAIWQGFSPCKISLFGDMDRLLQLQKMLRDDYAGLVNPVVSDVDCLDLMPVGVSKGAALAVLRKELALHPEEIATVGDSFNDLSMLTATPHSFAMAHSVADVRRQAAYTVHSVAQAVEAVLEENKRSVAHGGSRHNEPGSQASRENRSKA